MSEERKYLVTVLTKDGGTSTALHFTSADEATKLKLVAEDLGLVIDDQGFSPDDPDIRRISIRHAEDSQFRAL